MEEMCFFMERSWSKMTPKFRVESVGVRGVPLKIKEEEVSLARCCRVPMIRYSVFEGLTDRRLVVSQV
jgi:hypothetical protein